MHFFFVLFCLFLITGADWSCLLLSNCGNGARWRHLSEGSNCVSSLRVLLQGWRSTFSTLTNFQALENKNKNKKQKKPEGAAEKSGQIMLWWIWHCRLIRSVIIVVVLSYRRQQMCYWSQKSKSKKNYWHKMRPEKSSRVPSSYLLLPWQSSSSTDNTSLSGHTRFFIVNLY